MTTLSEDLDRAVKVLRGITDHDVQVVDQSVYVNFGYYEALVIDVRLTQYGKTYGVEAFTWDQSGGVSDEMFVAEVRMEQLPAVVKSFLDDRAEDDCKLEEALAEMPEDL